MHINYPSNPTTASADLECFAAVAVFGLRHNIIICHDNAYSEVYFDGVRPPSFLQAKDAKKIGIEFHSLSKTYLMTGWRIGVAVGHADVIAALGDVKSNYETGIFPVVQQAGVAALTGDQSLLETMRRHFSGDAIYSRMGLPASATWCKCPRRRSMCGEASRAASHRPASPSGSSMRRAWS